MNHSILTCGRTTHLKIVAVALITAVLCATVGLKARRVRRQSPQALALFGPRVLGPLLLAGGRADQGGVEQNAVAALSGRGDADGGGKLAPSRSPVFTIVNPSPSCESIRNRALPPAVLAWQAFPQKRSSDSPRRSPP